MGASGAAPEDSLLTIEEFERLPEPIDHRLELVQGRLVREPLPAPRHGRIAVKIAGRLDAFAERHGLGLVFDHTGFALYRDPDTVRGPDLAFVASDRVPPTGYAGTFWRMAPDLAIEILSPSNRRRQILEKVNEYLEAGSRLVWVVDPERRTINVYPAGRETVRIDVGGTLEGGDVLPGFSLPLAELFGTP